MELNTSHRHWKDIIPVQAILDDVIVSRRGDLTLGWELSLPVAGTLSEQDYDAMVTRWYEEP